ncbi:mitochondrial putative tRNA dimethylallyltransferase [Stipitochalara longipes BDJ]|nr:mitochondrial putative tRNA dimethylallyltransferase [Stipitochalara longipes BDJ]
MTMRPPKDPLLVVLGATGTGKSQLAIDLAKRFNGEVINGDAMQMYDGLPIITNKITVEEQQGIPHHLLGFIALNEEPWRVGLFKKKAGQIIREIRSRERLPIVVGGTHYYTQSLVFEDSLLKDQVAGEEQDNTEYSNEEIVERFPVLAGSTETMIERLRGVDPVMADRWHPKDRRKIRRSLEIFLTSGKKASDHYAEQKERKLHEKVENGTSTNLVGDGSTLLFWVHAESESLKQRLDARVDKMLDAGLLDEVKSMEAFLSEQLKSGVIVDRTRGIWVSIGWKEFEPYLKALETGNVSKEDLKKLLELSIEQTKAATRQYAKRQVRWIRLNLMPALSDENVLNKLYLLDGTDITQWAGAVSDPAISVAAKFLEGSKLPLPHEMSEAARKILSPTDGLDEKPDVWFRQECEICHMVAVNDVQWQTHLKSRRHRALAKKKQKNEANGTSSYLKNDSMSVEDIS